MGRCSFLNAPRKPGVRLFKDGCGHFFENYRTLALTGPSLEITRPKGTHARPPKGKSLAEKSPEIALQWHPRWNDGIKPEDVSWSSNYLFYWSCSKKHAWAASLNSRTSKKKHGCPCCSGREVTSENNLAELFPDHAKDWHPSKNGDLTPADVTPKTHIRVHWKRKEHPHDEWFAPVSYRTVKMGTGGAGYKSKLRGSSKEEILLFWQMKHLFNDVKSRVKVANCEIDIALTKYKLGIDYDGRYYHKNKQAKDLEKTKKIERTGWTVIRIREYGLSKERKDDVVLKKGQSTYRWQSIERIIGLVTEKVGTSKKIKRYLKEKKLRKLKEFRQSVIHLQNVPLENSLYKKYPQVAEYWDKTKNLPLTARDVSARDNSTYYFKCPECSDSFESNPANMVRSRKSGSKGCLNCTGRKVSHQNNLRTSFPDLVESSWDFKRNEKKPKDFTDSSNKYAYWICRHCGNSTHRSINSVTANQGKRARGGYFVCHKCKGQEMQKAGANTLISEAHRMHPILMKEWDTKRNKGLRLEKLSRVQAKKELGWICSLCSGKFRRRLKTRIKNLQRGVHGCPVCRYFRSMEKKARTLEAKYGALEAFKPPFKKWERCIAGLHAMKGDCGKSVSFNRT